MSSAFVPFLPPPGRPAPADFPIHQDEAHVAGAFAAMVPNTNSAATTASAQADAQARTGKQPSVSLQKDGDRVTHIRIQCSCGEIIELECDY